MKKNKTTECKCLDLIRERLTAHHGPGSAVELELKQFVDSETLSLGTALPPLNYSYRDGKKRKRSYVTFNFCPFCGKRDPYSKPSASSVKNSAPSV